MKKIFFILIMFGFLNAGVFTNELIKCMVKNTNNKELKLLKTWIYFAFSQDEDLKKYSKISKKEEERVNKLMANYVTDLLTNRCKKEYNLAIKNDGTRAISDSFEYLGRIAGVQIMSNPNVVIFIQKFSNYIDLNKFKDIQ